MLDPDSTLERSSTASRVEVVGEALDRAIDRTRTAAAVWWSRAVAPALTAQPDPGLRWSLGTADIGPACETLLADRLFHDLSDDEREGLLAWIRAEQGEDGAWRDGEGRPDLSLTALGWWARRHGGDDPEAEDMVRASRTVLELGGAQRASFSVRLWMAMGGQVPWSWLPAVPSELWLLPASAPLSPFGLATWPRGLITPYHLLARAPARIQLEDASALLLTHKDGEPIPPRLTRPGLAGDLLQAFDRSMKVARKLPRFGVERWSLQVARDWVESAQQRHGGWFSVRPTLLSLVALRVCGVTSDDPRMLRGLGHLRRGRHEVPGAEKGAPAITQGLHELPLALAARLGLAVQPTETAWLIAQEINESGPWQMKADAPAGGWPVEPGAASHLDVVATCRALELLAARPPGHDGRSWPASRRAAEVLLAMQEADGSFARFERDEAEVPLAQLPWRDADRLAQGRPGDEATVERTALALRQLGVLGWRTEDDRVRRGLDFLERNYEIHGRAWALGTLAELGATVAIQLPPEHPLRRGVDRMLRSRQREDGSFGTVIDTARVLGALLDLDGDCVQSRRAADWLLEQVESHSDADLVRLESALARGVGLSPAIVDGSAGAREVHLALRRYRALKQSS